MERQAPRMTLNDRNRFRSQRSTAIVFALLAVATGLAVPRLAQGWERDLPAVSHDVRFTVSHGSRQQIQITKLQSCGCWAGPRGQAHKKFKFKITNNSGFDINIAGGIKSNIRLLAAFPETSKVAITMPTSDGSQVVHATEGTPADVDLLYTTSFESYDPPELKGANDLFGVADGWRVYLFPPNENRVLEDMDVEGATFPTYVYKEVIEPGESYYGRGHGIGSWVFYVPLTSEFYEALNASSGVSPESEVDCEDTLCVMSNGPDSVERSTSSRAINVLGIGIVDPDSGEILGFAPTPSDSMYSSPEEF